MERGVGGLSGTRAPLAVPEDYRVATETATTRPQCMAVSTVLAHPESVRTSPTDKSSSSPATIISVQVSTVPVSKIQC